ncbi:10927_t:CDS:2 [Acaulospora morrowiae]|uniref:10927_t:CDS:1 n=1 Tax=Acaulospora morrowiae TaxID=94023 RepID=A0A9N8ZYA0_9GLOM|nr:10927_t:CDS:2 [Acaulospora morrowiae]
MDQQDYEIWQDDESVISYYATPPSSPMSRHFGEHYDEFYQSLDPIPVNRSGRFDDNIRSSLLPSSDSNVQNQNQSDSQNLDAIFSTMSIGDYSPKEREHNVGNDRGSGVSRDVFDLQTLPVSALSSGQISHKEHDSATVETDLIQFLDRDHNSTDGPSNINEINAGNASQPIIQPHQPILHRVDNDISVNRLETPTLYQRNIQNSHLSQVQPQSSHAQPQNNGIFNFGIDDAFLPQSREPEVLQPTKTPQNLLKNSEKSMHQVHNELIKIDIIQCQFIYNGKPPSSLKARYRGDLAFLYRSYDNYVGGGDVSICIESMSIEAAIPISQLCGFKITNDGKINLKFILDFQVNYRHHLGGYPYLLEPTTLKSDPTDGKFDKLLTAFLTSYDSVEPSKLYTIETNIETQWFRRHGLYLTCIFPTERRAMACPTDSSLHKLCLDLETRFNLRSSKLNLRYKNKNGELIGLKDENDWVLARREASGKSLLRLEIHIW